jgi:hypothetical protein
MLNGPPREGWNPLAGGLRLPPSGERDAVELYVRTYSTILRSSGDVRLRAFVPAHLGIGSSLHAGADVPIDHWRSCCEW